MAAPTVVTDYAEKITRSTATLVGHSPWVDPGEAASYVIFQWGKTTAYGNWTYWEQAFSGEAYHHDIKDLEALTLYHFRIVGQAAGKFSYGADKTFTTTTIDPPPAPTPFMGWIIEKLNSASAWFYDIYLNVNDWPWPFYYVAGPFWWLADQFSGLAWDFYDFSVWVDDIANKIVTILSSDNIYSYFKDLFDAALNAWNWVVDYFWNVWDIVDIWWSATSSNVLGWIDAAKQWAKLWIDYLEGEVNKLRADVNNLIAQIPDVTELLAWFTDWWSNILANLDGWWSERLGDIDRLINTAFTIREGFWAGWQDWRDKVTEFFTDPEDWLYKSVDRIIERFW